MELYVAGRRQGKTTRMLGWMTTAPKDEPRVLVVHSQTEAERLRRQLPEMYGWRVVTSRAVEQGYLRGRQVPCLGVDNVDMILPQLLGYPVGAMSINEDD